MAIWSIKLLMDDLVVKDALLMILLMHTTFGAPYVSYHDDLIGPLGLFFCQ